MHTWRGRILRFTNAAYWELYKHGLSPEDVIDVLDNGYDFPGKQRSEGIYEKCLRKGCEIIKVVVAESYSFDIKETVWAVVHVMVVRT
ncbi:MAG: hypothetical protein Q7T16_00830 [Candidatus Burarchaeum sp.]|nr:hypothetical protein [Candidatus Burarchaeum sp.]MDO8339181.1 hypothetical protein [Candidatus Burarchaeum sp.]